MARFNYVALDARGEQSAGVLEANSSNEVVAHLRQSGYFPTSVLEEGKGAPPKSANKGKSIQAASKSPAKKKGAAAPKSKAIKTKILMIFTRQLATLIDAGLPLLRGLNVLAKQERDPVLKSTINNLADAVQGGSTFSESLAQHPKIFNKLYINMVKAGELGGVLELVLNRLAEFQEKAQKIKNKVVAAMFYPIIVLFIAVAIMGFLLVFIVPKFQAIFNDMLNGAALPGLTVFVINVSNAVKTAFWPPLNFLITGGILFAIIVSYVAFASSKFGRRFLDTVKLKAPVFGDLTRKNAISRFSRTLGTLVTSGVPILQALNITRETAGNSLIGDAIGKVHDSVKEGESIVQPLEASGVFPPMVISMIDVGEETGQLPEMLLKIAEVYDDEVDNAVAGLTSLLEPIMIVFLAVVVGTIVIALFLPLIEIIKKMSNQ
jgi:type IV pilus assembly protein PilC